MLTPGVCASRVHRQGEIRPLPCLLSRSPPALTPGPESHPLSNNRPILRARMRKDLAMSDRSKRMAWTALLLAALLPLVVSLPATAQLQWSSKDGSQSFKVGILGQLQAVNMTVMYTTAESVSMTFTTAATITLRSSALQTPNQGTTIMVNGPDPNVNLTTLSAQGDERGQGHGHHLRPGLRRHLQVRQGVPARRRPAVDGAGLQP